MTFLLGCLLALATMLPAQGAIGTSLIAGNASWCAPTPKYCHGWGGHSLVGAMPGYTHPVWAKVCRQDSSVCITVHVISFCACGNHVIDLSPYAFKRLAPLSRGIVAVEVEVLTRVPTVLPATDAAS